MCIRDRRGTQASGRAATCLRLCQAGSRGATGADCLGAWYRTRVGGEDQDGLGRVGEGRLSSGRKLPRCCRHARQGRSLLTSPLVRRLVPILILVIGAMALFIDFMPGPNGPGSGAKFFSLSNFNGGLQTPQTKLGLDLSGGFEIKYGVQSLSLIHI